MVFALPPFPVAIRATNLHQKQRGKEGSATQPLRDRLGAWEVICYWTLCVCSAVSREDPDKDEELWCWQRLQQSGLQRGHSSHRALPPFQSPGLATVLMGRKGTSRHSSGSGVPGPGDRLDFIAPDPPVGGSHEESRYVAERQNVGARRDMGVGSNSLPGSAGPGVGT